MTNNNIHLVGHTGHYTAINIDIVISSLIIHGLAAIGSNVAAIHITGAPTSITAGINSCHFSTCISIQIGMTSTTARATIIYSNLIVLRNSIINRRV